MEVFLMFVLYSFLGCVLEDVYYYALHRKYVSKRTLLNLPLCPVYGISALVLFLVNKDTQNPVLLFCNGFLAVSAVELTFYLVSKRIYNVEWWDYSKHKINFMGGVSLFYSVMWGFLNIVFAKIVHPAVSLWIGGISETSQLFVGLFIAVYLIADFKETHNELLKHKKGEKSSIFEKFSYLKSNN